MYERCSALFQKEEIPYSWHCLNFRKKFWNIKYYQSLFCYLIFKEGLKKSTAERKIKIFKTFKLIKVEYKEYRNYLYWAILYFQVCQRRGDCFHEQSCQYCQQLPLPLSRAASNASNSLFPWAELPVLPATPSSPEQSYHYCQQLPLPLSRNAMIASNSLHSTP